MKKRFTKYLALFLSATMVFTMNTAVFGATGAGEAVEEESKEPEIVELDPNPYNPFDPDSIGEDYANGFAEGLKAADTDQGNADDADHNKDAYNAGKQDIENNNHSNAYEAGFEDGYVAYGHKELYSAYREGFAQGYYDARTGLDTDSFMSDTVDAADEWRFKKPRIDTNDDGILDELKDATLITAYQDAYKEGVTIGKNAIATTAEEAADDYVRANDTYIIWTTPEAFLASEVFENMTNAGGALDGKPETYINSWTTGFTKAFNKYAREIGHTTGRNTALIDVTNKAESAASFGPTARAEVDKYLTDYPAASDGGDYLIRWKTVNKLGVAKTQTDDAKRVGEWKADDDGDFIPVGESYLDSYIEAYKEVYQGYYSRRKKCI